MHAAVLVPVKDLTQAKSRLSPLLSLQERQRLAEIMLEVVLEAIGGLPGILRKVVVTSYAPAMLAAERHGMECFRETTQVSESHSVDSASAALEAEGVGAVLRVPLDLPLIRSHELGQILEQGERGARAVLVPSRDGTGTNAVYRAPPTLFRSRFGPRSFALHEGNLRRLAEPYVVLPLESLALDLDDPSDVEALLVSGLDCAAVRYLAQIGAAERLVEWRKARA
jgi:2-phospho-L-lactate guanylyltransferase